MLGIRSRRRRTATLARQRAATLVLSARDRDYNVTRAALGETVDAGPKALAEVLPLVVDVAARLMRHPNPDQAEVEEERMLHVLSIDR